jgi:hypothetical protein
MAAAECSVALSYLSWPATAQSEHARVVLAEPAAREPAVDVAGHAREECLGVGASVVGVITLA